MIEGTNLKWLGLVQWLGLCTSTTGAQVRSLTQELRSRMPYSSTKKKKKLVEFKPYLVAQVVKNPPAMQETPVLFLDREDVLEKGMATHSSSLAWRIPWTV